MVIEDSILIDEDLNLIDLGDRQKYIINTFFTSIHSIDFIN